MSLILALDNGSISKYCRLGQRRFPSVLLGLALLVLLTSCNSKKYLKEDQSFLKDNKVSIKSKHRISNTSDLYDNLVARYQQNQTKVVAGIPRHVFYYQYQKKLAENPDRKKWDDERLIKNRPVIHDSLKAAYTTLVFEKYLGERGYRYADVTFRAKTQDKETTVYYHVDPGPRMYIDTFLVVAKDTALQRIVNSNRQNRILKQGSPLDIQLYNQEKQRLVNIIQNEGYATFDESYVSLLEVDTSLNRVRAIMRLLNLNDSTYHQIYKVGSVHIFPDFDQTSSRPYFETKVDRIIYHLPDSNVFTIKPEALSRNVYLTPGEIARRDDLYRTIKNLGRIEYIKFVTPSAFIDTSSFFDPRLHYTFLLTRNKKIPFDFNAELTYANIAAKERRSLFGTAFSAFYRDMNTFHGAEVLKINMETGFEFNFINKSDTSGLRLLNSINIGVGTTLSFPRFMDPIRMYSMIGYTRDPEHRPLLGYKLSKWLKEDATTRLGLGYNFVDIDLLYKYYTFNANLSYDIQPDLYRKLTITRLGFELFVPEPKEAFQAILDSNRFQRESFGKQLFTGFLFRNYLFEINSKAKHKTGYFKMLHSMELSGVEILALNELTNLIRGTRKEFVLGRKNDLDEDVVNFSHYAKGELDLIYTRDFSKSSQFAFKLNLGIASPFGGYTRQVPYLKQFFVGGALSNRAWQIRELGPGSYEDKTPTNPNLPFYQTGDFKIDMSAEFRFDLLWYFKGAVFVDAANVWTLNENDNTRTGAEISHNFYKEFGIGYGFGIRLDLEFFIIRLDFGYKLHNPYPVDGSRWLKRNLNEFPGGAEPQIAVGLPF